MYISPSRLADYDGNKLAIDAYKRHYGDMFLTVAGEITRILPDDTIGIPHQRFVITLIGTDQSILIVHNLDYGERLVIESGDVVKVSGEYVWNQHGGLIHLTHHDPNGKFREGSVEIINPVHPAHPPIL